MKIKNLAHASVYRSKLTLKCAAKEVIKVLKNETSGLVMVQIFAPLSGRSFKVLSNSLSLT